jgi:glycosyltransferase involved in cell wall biosynthesis
MKLTILMPTLVERRDTRKKLVNELLRQTRGHRRDVELSVFEDDGTMFYGRKMHVMYSQAKGDYVCCVDDDDWVAGNYVEWILNAIAIGPDVVTFDLYRVDLAQTWTFGTKYQDREVVGSKIGMTANHLCVWRRELAQSVPWPDETQGADVAWYTEMQRKYPDALEQHIDAILYLYFFDRSVSRCHERLDDE